MNIIKSIVFFILIALAVLFSLKLSHCTPRTTSEPVLSVSVQGDSLLLSSLNKDSIISSLKKEVERLSNSDSVKTVYVSKTIVQSTVDSAFVTTITTVYDTVFVDSIQYVFDSRNIDVSNPFLDLHVKSFKDSANVDLALTDELVLTTLKTCSWNNVCETSVFLSNKNPYVTYKSAVLSVDQTYTKKRGLHFGIGLMAGPSFDLIHKKLGVGLTVGPYATWQF